MGKLLSFFLLSTLIAITLSALGFESGFSTFLQKTGLASSDMTMVGVILGLVIGGTALGAITGAFIPGNFSVMFTIPAFILSGLLLYFVSPLSALGSVGTPPEALLFLSLITILLNTLFLFGAMEFISGRQA